MKSLVNILNESILKSTKTGIAYTEQELKEWAEKYIKDKNEVSEIKSAIINGHGYVFIELESKYKDIIIFTEEAYNNKPDILNGIFVVSDIYSLTIKSSLNIIFSDLNNCTVDLSWFKPEIYLLTVNKRINRLNIHFTGKNIHIKDINADNAFKNTVKSWFISSSASGSDNNLENIYTNSETDIKRSSIKLDQINQNKIYNLMISEQNFRKYEHEIKKYKGKKYMFLSDECGKEFEQLLKNNNISICMIMFLSLNNSRMAKEAKKIIKTDEGFLLPDLRENLF